MKKVFSAVAVAAVAISAVAVIPALASQTVTGNGGPSGSHYNLNIIGVPKNKTADMTSGNRIFVSLSGHTTINLVEGDTFAVLDANGTDGTAAFELPNPDPNNTGVTDYSVYARPLGIPGGSAEMQTCAYDDTGTLVCSQYTLDVNRNAGQSKFQNVSKYLLYIYVAQDITDSSGNVLVSAGRYPLFDSALQNYFWDYNNNGLKVLQLRFYPIPTTVPAS